MGNRSIRSGWFIAPSAGGQSRPAKEVKTGSDSGVNALRNERKSPEQPPEREIDALSGGAIKTERRIAKTVKRRAHAYLVEAPAHQVRSSGSYGIAFTFARVFNRIMVFHSVAVAGGLIVAIALALAIHRCWANYRDKKQHGG